jgi:peptide deformylase
MCAVTIVTVPDPALRAACAPVEPGDPAWRTLAQELVESMRAARGLGLAAPQVGVPVRVAVVEVAGELLVLANPRLVRSRGTQQGWEGCLSVPDTVASVSRAFEVVVETLDGSGRVVRIRRDGLTARAILHELDHLDGRLYVDLVPADALVDTREHPTPPNPLTTPAPQPRGGSNAR